MAIGEEQYQAERDLPQNRGTSRASSAIVAGGERRVARMGDAPSKSGPTIVRHKPSRISSVRDKIRRVEPGGVRCIIPTTAGPG